MKGRNAHKTYGIKDKNLFFCIMIQLFSLLGDIYCSLKGTKCV